LGLGEIFVKYVYSIMDSLVSKILATPDNKSRPVVGSLIRIFGKRWKGKGHESKKIKLLEEDTPEGTGSDLSV
jgi:hypothetical protein